MKRWLYNKLAGSPVLARVVPFAIFLVLTSLQDQFGEPGRYWIYFLKTVVGVWLIWLVRPLIAEMKWAFSWEAVAVGIGVFAVWVGLDGWYPHFGRKGLMWNPTAEFDPSPIHVWFFILVRIVGSSVVVPPLEEVFYRSFAYRWIVKPEFESVPFSQFNAKAFWGVAIVFGFVHPQQWLAGIICGVAYQWLVLRKNRLGDAMTAHAITNFLLGLWVVWRQAWQFW